MRNSSLVEWSCADNVTGLKSRAEAMNCRASGSGRGASISLRSGGKTPWRAEPTLVENRGDDLWIGVKGQANSVIAGSPRNAFRCSLGWSVVEVELCLG